MSGSSGRSVTALPLSLPEPRIRKLPGYENGFSISSKSARAIPHSRMRAEIPLLEQMRECKTNSPSVLRETNEPNSPEEKTNRIPASHIGSQGIATSDRERMRQVTRRRIEAATPTWTVRESRERPRRPQGHVRPRDETRTACPFPPTRKPAFPSARSKGPTKCGS